MSMSSSTCAATETCHDSMKSSRTEVLTSYWTVFPFS